MKSIDHSRFGNASITSVCRSRRGKRFLVRRGRLSLSCRYTRSTFL